MPVVPLTPAAHSGVLGHTPVRQHGVLGHTPVRQHGVLALGIAHALALLAAAGAASLYAGWLAPADFASWAMALALARAGQLLLDGGFKTALVRRASLPSDASLRRLRRCSMGLAMLASLLLAAVVLLPAWPGLAGGNRALLLLYPAAYLLSYPAMFIAQARLERAQQFRALGQAESAGVLVEFGLPVLLMAAGLAPLWALLPGVWLARCGRCGWLVLAARRLQAPGQAPLAVQAAPDARLWRDAAGVQAVALLSMLRDSMHLWLLAPWFGAGWAGAYAWAFTACALLGQVGVLTAARTALPALRALAPALRWPAVLAQVRWLAIATLPPMLMLPAWLAWADARLWQGHWQAALVLLPWVVARWLGGVATGSLGAWLLVARQPWAAARAHALWAAAEMVVAAAALAWFGPTGLALAAALSVWVGVLVFLRAAEPGLPWWPRVLALLRVLLLRPSLVAAALLAAWTAADAAALPAASLALPLCWLAEPALLRRVRPWLAGAWARLRSARRGKSPW